MTAWNDQLLTNPHAAADKRQRVQRMFAAIAPSYDLNNRLHSLWMDQRWRKRAVKLSQLKSYDVVVDVACGTGDLSYLYYRAFEQFPDYPMNGAVIGIDFTFQMLPLAIAKHFDSCRQFMLSGPVFVNGDAMALPVEDNCCDVVSIAFGIRNVADPAAAAREFYRVLRPGGRVIILEFSLPTNAVLRGLYNFYFRRILPRTATLISRDKTGAYKYLPESVCTFIGREQMITMLRDAGFEQVEQHPMTFGVCVCYRGVKL